jgi:hypothetical protein
MGSNKQFTMLNFQCVASMRSCSRGNGRGERIRTSDPLVPNQVRYQTALRPECDAGWMPVVGVIRKTQALGKLAGHCTDLDSLAEILNSDDDRDVSPDRE